MQILGISAFYHDSAAALVRDGVIVAAAQEERFTRKKHDPRFPHQAVNYCLSEAKLDQLAIDLVVFYDKPFLKFERLLETYTEFAPRGFRSFRLSMPVWLREKLFLRKALEQHLAAHLPKLDFSEKLLFSEHHLSHAASAFYPSPYENASILTMDGVGEWATTSIAVGRGSKIDILREIHFPHSLGLLYSAFTYYTGFKVNSGEYKLMGLAPYGEPKFVSKILNHLIDLKEDGSFSLNMRYFDYCTGLRMTSREFNELFGGPARKPEEPLTQFHMDIAASIQAVTELAVLAIARHARRVTGVQELCLAGGVALNCVANGKLVRDGGLKDIWIQPAAGDAGGALGAALAAYHIHANQPRVLSSHGDAMRGGYLGQEYDQAEIEECLLAAGAVFTVLQDEELMTEAVAALVSGKALGWFQGRMEFGPRALGARSILGDPRSPQMQSQLNLKVKFRESFRPFAPAIIRENLEEWFELEIDSPYMLVVAPISSKRRLELSESAKNLFGIDRLNVPRSEVPSVTHVDYTARIQTVHGETNPRFHKLLSMFKSQTGCPILVNTSFNVRGEPIVSSPEDAFKCFMGTDIEALAIGNCFLRKEDQPEYLRINYKDRFEPD